MKGHFINTRPHAICQSSNATTGKGSADANFPSLRVGMRSTSIRLFLLFTFYFFTFSAFSQNGDIIKGNSYYKDSVFDKAEEMYRKSIAKKPTPSAQYNLGNTLYKKQKPEEAIQQFDATAGMTEDAEVKAKALYNKGVVHHRSNQMEEAIAAYKQALRLTPDDAEIRKNLQLALRNQQQKNPQQKPKEQKKKEEKPKEDQKKNKQPPPPKLSKKQAEQYLKSLSEKERQLQEKMQKKVGVPSQPEKDW
jgi:Ca-activated chloride channel homolog